jgi:hypothetical protein
MTETRTEIRTGIGAPPAPQTPFWTARKVSALTLLALLLA